MDETYYTDEMKAFALGLENIHNFPVDVAIANDEDGPYLCLVFDKADHERFGLDRLVIEDVAEYLVDLRNGLIERGARVTFAVTDEKGRQ